MSIIDREFLSHVWQRSEPFINQSQLPPDVVTIEFKRYNSTRNAWFPEDDHHHHHHHHNAPIRIETPRVLITQETTIFPHAKLLSDRTASTMLMSELLSRMHVPQHEKPLIIKKIFEVVEFAANAAAMEPIVVVIDEVTWRLHGSGVGVSDHHETNMNDMNRVIRESFETYMVKPVPATKTCIQNLEKVRLDDGLEATRVHESCVICMEGLEACVEVIRLPCSHLYHERCIVQWLETNHLCPLCRYQMPRHKH